MKFRKKPVMIEAVQWTGTNVDEIFAFVLCGTDLLRKDCAGPNGGVMPGGALVIHTLEGDHTASPGDWIIRGVKGEFYPCKPDIFESTHEGVDPANGAVTADKPLRDATDQDAK